MKTLKISPNNPSFKIYNNSILIGKSYKDNFADFDTLIIGFCNDYKSTLSIPDEILYIGSNAFVDSLRLNELRFSPTSKLKSIGKNAFKHCCLENICIPASVEKIKKGAF